MEKNRRFRICVSIRHTGKESVFPGFVPGIQADLHMMEVELWYAIQRITVSVHSPQENNIIVIYRQDIILEPDILSGNY